MGKEKSGSRGAAPTPRMNPRWGAGGVRPADAQNALQTLQRKMLEAQEALANETVEASAGGGAVKVVITGQQKIQSLEISSDAFGTGDKEMLEDLIVAAVNAAMVKSQEHAARRISAITGGLNLPGLT